MKQFDIRDTLNPVYNTVTGLTNTTFDSTNIVPDRGATEGQLKSVNDILQVLKDWLDENGCSDDPYIAIRQRLDQLEIKQDECCNNPQDSIVQTLRTRLDQLQTRIEACCDDPGGGSSGSQGYIPSQCVNNPDCDGGVVTVGATFNVSGDGSTNNPYRGTGQASGGSTTGASIVGYAFLVDTGQVDGNGNPIYKKRATGRGTSIIPAEFGGNFVWSLGGGGLMSMFESNSTEIPIVRILVAIDSNGCEGYTEIDLPNPYSTSPAVGP